MRGPHRLTSHPLSAGDREIPFRFAGQPLKGRASDSIAAALLANGVRVVGHSFKYRRPRGILAAGEDEPNAIVDVTCGGLQLPNVRASLQPLAAGMEVRPVLGAAAGLLAGAMAAFIPAAFYYKTFMWPHWHLYEPAIRRLAGLGRIDAASKVPPVGSSHCAVDVCVVGAGRSGLAAAIAAACQGKSVLVVDRHGAAGGSSRWRAAGNTHGVTALIDEARALGVTFWRRAMAFGCYEAGLLAVMRQGAEWSSPDMLWTVRTGAIVLATGAIERPLLFVNNDLPGVMLADSVLQYLTLHGVCCGSRPVVALANDTGYATALALKAAGADVTVIDSRPSSPRAEQARSAGLSVHCDTQVVAAHGRGRVQAVTLATGARLDTDLVAMAGGWTPTLHLYCQAGGKAVWDETRNLLVPAHAVGGVSLVGRAAGDWSPPDEGAPWTWTNAIALPASGPAKRCWIDLQNDVTLADVRLAARENLASVEHLKRYTTLGMATDQGKTSNVNGLAALADATGASMAALGTTTFRPPYVPVSFASLAGLQRGHLQSPLRRLAAERSHRRSQAFFRDYGGVLRPAWYGADDSAVGRECLAARQGAVVLDASSLGKVAVFGPAAGALLDFLFCTRMSTLAAGRCRYGLMTNEAGIVVDDGVVLCLSSEHFVVSCSSSHVGAFVASAEEWRQTRFGYSSVHVHDTTAQWATLSLSGPRSREVLATLAIVETLDDAALGHMSFCGGSFRGREARLARVSFTGERGYEISVPAGLASELWEALVAAGATPCGIEALSVLRAEKGYIYVGVDSDGETMPHDLGFDAPRGKRQDAFLGDRSLHVPAAADLHRKQLVGLQSPDKAVLAAGAHIVAADPKRRSIGFVTSSYFSPALGGGVALALVEGGRRLIGQEVQWFDQGKLGVARVVAPCRYDPQGARHHV